MMYRYNLFVIVLLILTISCSRKNNKESNKSSENDIINLNIDYRESESILCLDTLIDSLVYIPLEKTTPYVGNIRKLLIHDDNMIIWDEKGKAVWIFNYRGKLVSYISKLGKGEGEYITISNVSVSESGIINIVDAATKSVLKFDLKGDFINRELFHGFPSDYVENGTKRYVFYHYIPEKYPNRYYIKVFEEEVFKKGFFPYKNIWHYDGDHFIMKNGKTFFYRKYDNNVYLIDEKDKISVALSIDFGESSTLSDELLEIESMEDFYKIVGASFYVGELSNVCLSDNFITFNYNICNKNSIRTANVVYDLNTDEHYNFQFATSNRFSLTPGQPIATDGTSFYGVIEPWQLSSQLRKEISQKFNQEIVAESNPIILKYNYLKKYK